MTEPAVLQADLALLGDYRFAKPVPTRSSHVLQIEVPWEEHARIHKILGDPPRPGENRWVAITLVTEGTAEAYSKATRAGSSIADKPKETKGPHSDYAQKLYQSYFMRSEKVCAALGTDEEFRKWVQRQPSCVSHQGDYIDRDGDVIERCEAAHVRRAGQSGTGYKASYSCVPLQHAEHAIQHQGGEAALLIGGLALETCTPETAKKWFDARVIEYREKWVHERLCAVMGVESLTDIDPEKLRKWCESKGVEEALPK